MHSNLKNKFAKKLAVLFAAPMFLYAGLAHSTATTTGHVLVVGTYGNGNINIVFDTTVGEPGCAANRVDIPGSHPLLKSFLAIAMMAKSSGSPLKVKTTGCFAYTLLGVPYNFPTIDTSNDGQMAIQQ